MEYRIRLKIADYPLILISDVPFHPETGYVNFVDTEGTTEPEVIIFCKNELPESVFDLKEPVFEAENETQKFYRIYHNNEGLIFVMYNQEKINEIQQIAVLNNEMNIWNLYYKPDSDGTLNPLKYPFGPIMMHYLTQKTGAVMMHASCVTDGSTGRIFTGFSGNGKSTISGIWAGAGFQIINDDRIILRIIDDEIYAYNTPMFYRDVPKKTKVQSIFLISHSPENKIKKVTGATALSRSMAFCIQNNFDKNQINNQLNFFSKAVKLLDVYDLGFVPDKNIIQFILDNEKGLK